MIIECYATNDEIESLEKGKKVVLENTISEGLTFKVLIDTKDYTIKASGDSDYIHAVKRKESNRLVKTDSGYETLD